MQNSDYNFQLREPIIIKLGDPVKIILHLVLHLKKKVLELTNRLLV
jgi:hypothetical protein